MVNKDREHLLASINQALDGLRSAKELLANDQRNPVVVLLSRAEHQLLAPPEHDDHDEWPVL